MVRLNPNSEVADDIKKKVAENEGYCPCEILKTEDTKCMCKDFKEKINRKVAGFCHCGLYENVV